MNQFFTHYTNWEDYQNGMYCGTIQRDETQVNRAKAILSNTDLFGEILSKLVNQWPISSKVNLTNNGINRRAWLGAAACCFDSSVTEINTRYAWNELNDSQQFQANTVAERVISEFENQNHVQTTITF